MSVKNPFAELLVEARTRKGWSRSQLASETELSYPYISQLETGIRKPSRSAAYRLAAALDVDPISFEATIPRDDGALELQRARRVTAELSAGRPHETVLMAAETTRPPRQPSGNPDDLADQILDLVEEVPAADRLALLATVQQRTMERMLAERESR